MYFFIVNVTHLLSGCVTALGAPAAKLRITAQNQPFPGAVIVVWAGLSAVGNGFTTIVEMFKQLKRTN